MNFYKLVNIIGLYLLGQSFVSAILIDDFLDNDISCHVLTSGTDINGIERGQIGGNWFFPNAGSRIALVRSTNQNSLEYLLPTGIALNFDDISTFKFDVRACTGSGTTSSLGTIKLHNVAGSRREINIDLSGITNQSGRATYDFDLAGASFSDWTGGGGTFDTVLPPFDPSNITKIDICFNTNNTPFDINIDSIEAIPEPFSMITLAGGTLNFIRRKQQRRSQVS